MKQEKWQNSAVAQRGITTEQNEEACEREHQGEDAKPCLEQPGDVAEGQKASALQLLHRWNDRAPRQFQRWRKELLLRIMSLKALRLSEDIPASVNNIWDANPWLLGIRQGAIDLRTGSLLSGRPEDSIRTTIPTTWKGLDEPAPRFEQFLNELFADRQESERGELIAFLQRALGYGLTGCVNEHIFLLFYSEKRQSGEHILMRTLERVLGKAVGVVPQVVWTNDDHCSPSDHVQARVGSLQGKRIVWACEPERGARFASSQMKWLTESSDIVARHFSGRAYTFKPSHLFILLSNHKPVVDANDRIFWERLCPLVFTMRFTDHPEQSNECLRDPNLERYLASEASGILAWLVRGVLEWHRLGLAIPSSVRRVRQEYRYGESGIEGFVHDCCLLSGEATTPARALYRTYLNWADMHGFTPLSNKQFTQMLKQGEYVKWQRNGMGGMYQGIALVENK